MAGFEGDEKRAGQVPADKPARIAAGTAPGTEGAATEKPAHTVVHTASDGEGASAEKPVRVAAGTGGAGAAPAAPAAHPARPARGRSGYAAEFLRAENEDDDGYDPYSDRRPTPEPLFERDPWG